MLEGLAARVACQKFTDAVLADLESILGRMDRARQERQRWLEYHAAFHETLKSMWSPEAYAADKACEQHAPALSTNLRRFASGDGNAGRRACHDTQRCEAAES